MHGRVLIWAHGRDGALTCGFLEQAGFECHACQSLNDLEQEVNKGAGLLVIAGELLTADAIVELQHSLGKQPPWSDLPILVVAGSEWSGRLPETVQCLARVVRVAATCDGLRQLAECRSTEAAASLFTRFSELRSLSLGRSKGSVG
jgi:hypothetical protein